MVEVGGNKLLVILSTVCIIFCILIVLITRDRNSFEVVTKSTQAINTPKTAIKESTKQTKIILTGDVMLGRGVMIKSLGLDDPNYPFEKVADVLNKADLVFVNLENPIVSDCPFVDSGFKFCADPKMINGLKYANIDVVNIANNHTANYGADGVKQTINYLTSAGIGVAGDDRLVIKKINDANFGFLGFNFTTKEPTKQDYQIIKSAKSEVDILMVAVHWGVEYTDKPQEYQKTWAKDMFSAGADVIVGSHPHWVQTEEYINGRPVYYSLGNFVFDQMWSEETKKGLAIRLTYRGKDLVKEEELPIYMVGYAQPEWVGN